MDGYSLIGWLNDQAPAINQDNLNKMDKQIYSNDVYAGNLINQINDLTGNTIPAFVNGYYIKTNSGLGTVISLTPTAGNENNNCAVISASAGDRFIINGIGGNAGRLWCFVTVANKIISHAAANITGTNLILIAPENADKLILNCTGIPGACYKGYSVKERIDEANSNITNTKLNIPDNWLSGYCLSSTGAQFTASANDIASRIDLLLDKITKFTTKVISSGNYALYDANGDVLAKRAMESNHEYLVPNILINYPDAKTVRFDLKNVDGDTSKCNLLEIQYITDATTELLVNNIQNYGLLSKSDFVNGIYSNQRIDTSRTDVICNRFLIPVCKGDKVKFLSTTLKVAIGIYVGTNMSIQDATGWLDESASEQEYSVQRDGYLLIMLKKASGDILPSEYNATIKLYNTVNSRALSDGLGISKLLNQNEFTIAFLGDSLTAGVGTNYIYHMYLGDRFEWICKNYGYGGSGYVTSYSGTGGKMATGQVGMGVAITNSNKIIPNDFYTRIQTISTDIDALVIFGGTNDWGYDSPMEDFKAALDNVFSYAQTTFGRKPIIVMLPVHRKNDNTQNDVGLTLEDYNNVIVEKCRKYGIICVDTLGQSGLNPSNNQNDVDFFTRDDTNVSDGVHPNHYAHKMISNLIARIIADKLY